MAEHEEPPKPAVFYNLPEMLVNLNAQGRRGNFLKISLSLELDDAADIAAHRSRHAAHRRHLPGLPARTAPRGSEGSAGHYRLREELLARVNAPPSRRSVNDVLFKEMLVQ